MKVGALTHPGQVRDKNEDAYYATPPLFVVADGMGGHAAGDVASRLAVDTLAKWKSWHEPGHSLQASALAANERIYSCAQTQPACEGMGTTLTAGYFLAGQLHWIHVGDSRLYLLRAEELLLQTDDHSVVGELQRSGNLTENEARSHPHRNVLTRALGIEQAPVVDEGVLSVAAGDRLLFCTDGLHGYVPEEVCKEILLANEDSQTTARKLVASANERGGPDNVTVVVVDVAGGDLQ